MTHAKNLRLANPIVPADKLHRQPSGQYAINDIYLTIQGEGINAGIPMVIVRFAECNLRCTIKNAGFDCDTEFSSFRNRDITSLRDELKRYLGKTEWILLTGGEPGLQIDSELISSLKKDGFKLAIESNGTIKLPDGIDWITISPKSAEHTLRQRTANEVKYIRSKGMGLPETGIKADHYLISPAFQADGTLLREDLDWCMKLISEDPSKWRLSIQLHKVLGLR